MHGALAISKKRLKRVDPLIKLAQRITTGASSNYGSKLRALTGAERRSVGHRADFISRPRQG
jgi:hypothetical protein